jgi:GR25 family glycosyltransferase involved in LPS biosynthesis
MLTIEVMGGLGNQLFQIFTLIAYSKKYNQPYLIEKKQSFAGPCIPRNSYWDSFFDKLSYRLIQNPLNYPLIKEKAFEYNELPGITQDINKPTNLKLYGYFQSYKYFQEYIDDILNELDFNAKKENVIRKIKMSGVDVADMTSIHFRVGDYMKLQDCHPIMTLEYYKNAVQTVLDKDREQTKMLYFCENADIEFVKNMFINPLSSLFPSLTFIKADNALEDWEQMIAMSACKHHIIGNSTFSWWGAYFARNNDENKIVCYPDKWFGENMGKKNTSDLFPTTWIKCNTGLNSYLLENVYYINLEERKDRKELVESELIKLNWKYERFNAIRLKDGRAGCSMSHLKLLEMAKEKKLEYIVILEDDIQFTNATTYNRMLSQFNMYMASNKMEYDVLLIAGNLRPPIYRVNEYIYKISKSWTTTGYIVKKHYYDTMIKNIKEGIHFLIKNPLVKGQYEIDSYWQRLQLKDRWYILMPRTVTQRPNFSTIENRYTDYNHLMLDQ